jgi:hypothetical protein
VRQVLSLARSLDPERTGHFPIAELIKALDLSS